MYNILPTIWQMTHLKKSRKILNQTEKYYPLHQVYAPTGCGKSQRSNPNSLVQWAEDIQGVLLSEQTEKQLGSKQSEGPVSRTTPGTSNQVYLLKRPMNHRWGLHIDCGVLMTHDPFTWPTAEVLPKLIQETCTINMALL